MDTPEWLRIRGFLPATVANDCLPSIFIEYCIMHIFEVARFFTSKNGIPGKFFGRGNCVNGEFTILVWCY